MRWTFWDACSVTPWPHRGATRAVDRSLAGALKGGGDGRADPISACADRRSGHLPAADLRGASRGAE
jgi:hypothetical protein